MKVLSLFSGIGAFEKALTRLNIPHEVVNYCEIDKYASKGYSVIHNIPESLNLHDITKVNEKELKDIDLITYGFPCQDISIAGKGAGIREGTRSGLLYDALRIIKHTKPKYAICENVKALVGKKFKPDFDKLLAELESYGYTNYWQVLNAKDYGIPQNRERVFIISVQGESDFSFPEKFDNGLRLKDLLQDGFVDRETSYCLDSSYHKGGNLRQYFDKSRRQLVFEVDPKYYVDNFIAQKLIQELNGELRVKQATKKGYIIATEDDSINIQFPDSTTRRGRVQNGVSGTLETSCNMCIPVLTPDRENKRQNGRRFKTDGEPSFTLTEQDRHGILKVGELDIKGNDQIRRVYSPDGISPTLNCCGGGNTQPKVINLGNINPSQKGMNGNVFSSINLSPTLTTNKGEGVKILENSNYKIRKLTPLECIRLMGFNDEDFIKLKENNISDSQIYKMCGNSIVVNVLEEIFKKLFMVNT